jgi:hypothetical protein
VSAKGVNSPAESGFMGCLFIILAMILLGGIMLGLINILPGMN